MPAIFPLPNYLQKICVTNSVHQEANCSMQAILLLLTNLPIPFLGGMVLFCFVTLKNNISYYKFMPLNLFPPFLQLKGRRLQDGSSSKKSFPCTVK